MGWIAQTSGTIVDLNGVCFADAKHGWAVGDNGVVLHSIDGGKTWSPQAQGASSQRLEAVSFPTASFGCVVGFGGTILTTSDGGQTWRTTLHSRRENLFDVFFLDAVHGWITGAHGLLSATVDGGATWQDQTCPITQQVGRVFFVDASYGWAAGADGGICATQDGGKTWNLQSRNTPNFITGIAFFDRQRGFAVDLAGFAWSTVDGGQHWTSCRWPNTSQTLLSLDLVGSQGVRAVGAMGLLLSTDDSGTTWRIDNVGSSAELRAVDFYDANHGWAVGRGGTIMHYEQRVSVDVPSWTHEVAIDPVALVFPNGIYVKWAEGHFPHTPEHLERFMRGLRPAELRVISTRAAELRNLSAQVERVASEAVARRQGE